MLAHFLVGVLGVEGLLLRLRQQKMRVLEVVLLM